MPKSTKYPFIARLAFVLGGLATLILVGALLWAGFTAPLSSRMPVPSPDGRYFAYFNRNYAGTPGFDLIVARPEGELLGRIAGAPGRILWSNANHLVSVDPSGRQATVIANADDRFVTLSRIAFGAGPDPQWAPDGNKLAFLREEKAGAQFSVYDVQQPRLFTIPLSEGFRLDHVRWIAWSPGSEQLYFLNSGDREATLYELGVGNGNLRELARGKTSGESGLPQIAPDGSRIYWGPPENAVIEISSASRLWTLPAGAQALWWPWTRDSREFYFTRPDAPGAVFSHSFEPSFDRPVLAGVRENGFFDLDGNNYYFRDPTPPPERNSSGWMQAGPASPPQGLEGIELWPWERTLDGLILARRDVGGRVRYGLFDPDTHRLDAYQFPTDGEDYLRQVKSYRLVIATVALFAILAASVFWRRSDAKSGRAFPILLFLSMALGCGIVVGNSVAGTAAAIPYRMGLDAIGNQGWGISSSLPHHMFRQAQQIVAWLWALLPLAIMNFALSFPERAAFLKSSPTLQKGLYAASALPLLARVLGRWIPGIPTYHVAMIAVAATACVWAISLGANHERPPDKAGRHSVVWFATALGVLAAAYLGLWAARHGAPILLGAESPDALQLSFFVLAAWIAPSAMSYAVAARRPVGVGQFLSTLFRQLLMGIPGLAGFAVAWALAGLVVSGTLWAFSAWPILIAVLVAVLSILPFRGRLRVAIDRRFDRDRFEARERLTRLAHNLPHSVDRGALALQLEDVLTKALHARWCLLYVADRGSRKLVFQRGKTALSTEMRQVTFSQEEPLCEYLKQTDTVFEPLLADSGEMPGTIMAGAGARLQKLQAEVVLGLRRADLLGLIILGPKTTRDLYDSEELAALRSVAQETAAALENIDLFELAARDREARKELEVASHIQAKLFPTHFPKMTTGQLAGCCYPARTTGGDYYDTVELPGSKIGLIMADVPGRGMDAAMQAATLEKVLGLQIPASASLEELVERVNRELMAGASEKKPSTLFYGVFEGATRRLTYVNAGHPPPIALAGEKTQLLDATGFPLGLFPEISHKARTIVLPPGSMLLIYSDGAIDASNLSGDSFGQERLAGALSRELESDAERALARVVAEIRDFEGDAILEDDQTFLLLKVYSL